VFGLEMLSGWCAADWFVLWECGSVEGQRVRAESEAWRIGNREVGVVCDGVWVEIASSLLHVQLGW
jgi:hypothetical protein